MDKSQQFVAYIRVSTQRQGQSGLGLEAQEAAIRAFIEAKPGSRIIDSYREVESGRATDRPQLMKALNKAKLMGATLLIAKLDRLARNSSFFLKLYDSGVEVSFCDLPNTGTGAAGRFILQQMANVAELEAGLISERTKAALKAAKARGKKLGGHRGYSPTHKDREKAAKAKSAKRIERCQAILPIIEEIRLKGITSANGIAKELNFIGIKTPSGIGQWQATTVNRVISAA